MTDIYPVFVYVDTLLSIYISYWFGDCTICFCSPPIVQNHVHHSITIHASLRSAITYMRLLCFPPCPAMICLYKCLISSLWPVYYAFIYICIYVSLPIKVMRGCYSHLTFNLIWGNVECSGIEWGTISYAYTYYEMNYNISSQAY